MTIAEKIEYATDKKIVTFFKEGLFYKCYNEDAMVFVQKIKEYKVSSKFIKSIGAEVLSLGFPVSEVEKGNLSMANVSEKIGAKAFEENEGIKKDYATWKKSKQEEIIETVKEPTILYQHQPTMVDIVSMIKNFDLANRKDLYI